MLKKILLLLLLIGIGVGSYFIYVFIKVSQIDKSSMDSYYEVKRGDLATSILLTGSLAPLNTYSVSLQCPYSNVLLWVVDEGAKVKKGDLVLRFDPENLTNQINNTKNQLELIKKDLTVAKEERAILITTNKASLRKFMDAVVTRKAQYDKYWKLEGPSMKDRFTIEIATAIVGLKAAKKSYNDEYEFFNNTVFSDQTSKNRALEKLKNLKGSREQQENNYDNAIYNKKVFKRYTHPNKITSLINSLEQSKLNLIKEKDRIKYSLIKEDAKIAKGALNLKQYNVEFNKIGKYIAALHVYAPADGYVLYNFNISIGRSYRNVELLSIIDMHGMKVLFKIPEKLRSRIKIGTRVIVSSISGPDLKEKGYVSKVSFFADKEFRWNSQSLKNYEATVTLDDPNSKFFGLMTSILDIVTDERKDVLFVPVELPRREDDKYFVYLQKETGPEKVYIKIGVSNDKFVEVKKGLKEGDRLTL